MQCTCSILHMVESDGTFKSGSVSKSISTQFHVLAKSVKKFLFRVWLRRELAENVTINIIVESMPRI